MPHLDKASAVSHLSIEVNKKNIDGVIVFEIFLAISRVSAFSPS